MENHCVIKIFSCCLALIATVARTDAYSVCGDPAYKAAEAKSTKNTIVAEFMQRRNSMWVWESPSTITTIQVAAPEKFFGREKSSQAVEEFIKNDMDYFESITIAELAFVVRSLCLDPRRVGGHDLLNSIHDSMSMFLVNETEALEAENIVDFSLMLSALCINDYPIDPLLVSGLLRLQNEDGSFGQVKESAEATILMLRPTFCLSRMKNTAFNTTEVLNTVIKMRHFIMTQVKKPHPKSARVFIGPHESSTANALVALYKTMQPGEDPNKKWRCREVMDTLGLGLTDADNEYSLQERIMLITATDYLDLQGPGYKCIPKKNLDPIPTGYAPKCDYEKPETCGMKESKEPK